MPLTTQAASRKDLNTGLSEMQHRHFATVAAIIRGLADDGVREHVAEHFARELRKTNPRFDRERFIRATQAV
jgi:hypothetical protein